MLISNFHHKATFLESLQSLYQDLINAKQYSKKLCLHPGSLTRKSPNQHTIPAKAIDSANRTRTFKDTT